MDPAQAAAALEQAYSRASLKPEQLPAEQLKPLCRQLEESLLLYLDATTARAACEGVRRLGQTLSTTPPPSQGGRFALRTELDLARARKAGLDLALQLGFSDADAVRVATVASELARNVLLHAGSGTLAVSPVVGPRPGLTIVAEDRGPGIANLDEILAGESLPIRGAGLGILGSRRLVDELRIETGSGGTRVTARKYL